MIRDLILVVDISTSTVKEELRVIWRTNQCRYLVSQVKSIFSVAEVWQEKMDPEGELQVGERQKGFNINPGCRSR